LTPAKPASPPGELTGLDAFFASQPLASTPQGGREFGFTGESAGGRGAQGDAETDQFSGMGPLLEEADADVFQRVHAMV